MSMFQGPSVIWIDDIGEDTSRVVGSSIFVDQPKGGIKNDSTKPDLSLCPNPALEAMARALTFGANKYSRNNYRKGFKQTRLIAATLRHINAYSFGEDLDPESGLSHLDHAIASLAMLLTNITEKQGEDDR